MIRHNGRRHRDMAPRQQDAHGQQTDVRILKQFNVALGAVGPTKQETQVRVATLQTNVAVYGRVQDHGAPPFRQDPKEIRKRTLRTRGDKYELEHFKLVLGTWRLKTARNQK